MRCFDFNLPAGEVGGELTVQTSTTEGQRDLVGLGDDHGTMLRRAQDDPLDFGRLQRIHNQLLGRIHPADQINSLPTECIDNIFDAGVPHPDACGDAIHPWVIAMHRKLATVAGLPRDRLDLDDSRRDLGNLS